MLLTKRFIKSILIIVFMPLFLASCNATIDTNEIKTKSNYTVSASSISIENLNTNQDFNPSDGIYNSGYTPIDHSKLQPSFDLLLEKSLKTIQATGTGEDVKIFILDAKIQKNVNVADSIAFIGIATALAPREHRCETKLRISKGSSRILDEYIYSDKLPLTWSDAKQADKLTFLQNCLNSLNAKINKDIQTL